MCALQRQSFRMYPALGHVCSLKTREFKDAILDCRPYQRFMHLDLMSEQVPDATTLAKRRHSLERQGLGKAMLHDLNSELEKAGITARGGSIVDVTFTWALKLHEEQRPHTRPLKRTSPRKGSLAYRIQGAYRRGCRRWPCTWCGDDCLECIRHILWHTHS
ncbi:MAG: transposase [Coriobacteriaceae bacterium]|nr:MAG: transposase [Coriobacteriaceae bacterium]